MRSMNDSANLRIRDLAAGEADVCETILRSLPDWFGIEQSILQYRQDLDHMESLVAEIDERVVGFLAIDQHNSHTAEVHVMAVRQEFHGCGIGRKLVLEAEKRLHDRRIEYLEVKTLAPSKLDANYDRTRAFYTALGFCPVEENNLWGKTNPCLIMIKHLECQSRPANTALQTDRPSAGG